MIKDLISAGANLISGMMGQNAQENANAANQTQNALNLQYQHQANTHGIRWKVEDAIAAGLHPLAALGVNPASGPPGSVAMAPETGMANAAASMGQDLSRAIHATRTERERDAAIKDTSSSLTLQNMQLRNEVLAAQLAKLKQSGPPFPTTGDENTMPGQGNSGVKVEPSKTTTTGPNLGLEKASGPEMKWFQTPTGSFVWAPSDTYKNATEDSLYETQGFFRNQVVPMFDNKKLVPPPFSPGEGKVWTHTPITGEWRATPARRSGTYIGNWRVPGTGD